MIKLNLAIQNMTIIVTLLLFTSISNAENLPACDIQDSSSENEYVTFIQGSKAMTLFNSMKAPIRNPEYSTDQVLNAKIRTDEDKTCGNYEMKIYVDDRYVGSSNCLVYWCNLPLNWNQL